MSKAKRIRISVKDAIDLDGWNIHELSKKYIDHLDATIYVSYWYDETSLYLGYTREETDEEYAMRLKKGQLIANRKKTQDIRTKEKDLSELKRIKEKYGLE